MAELAQPLFMVKARKNLPGSRTINQLPVCELDLAPSDESDLYVFWRFARGRQTSSPAARQDMSESFGGNPGSAFLVSILR